MANGAAIGRPFSWWLWAISTAVFSTAALALFYLYFFSGAALEAQAVKNGQRVYIALKDGAVEGNFVTLPAPKPLEAPAKPEEPQPAEAKPVEEPKPATPPEKPEAKPETPDVPLMPAARIKPQENPEVTTQELPPPAEAAPAEAVPAEAPKPPKPIVIRPSAVSAPADPRAPLAIAANTEISLEQPNEALLEKTAIGDLPKVGQDGTKSWQFYAAPVSEAEGPVIAVLVTGLGLSRNTTDAILTLPRAISCSFSPYALDTPSWVMSSRNLGHEVFIDLPVETSDYPAHDPGPHALLNHNLPEENLRRLRWNLSRVTGFIGIHIPALDRFFTSDEGIKQLLTEVQMRGLIASFGAVKPNEVLDSVSRDVSLPALRADAMLDSSLTDGDAAKLLAMAEEKAKKEGKAFVVIEAYPRASVLLSSWTKTLSGKGITLVPVSALVRQQEEKRKDSH